MDANVWLFASGPLTFLFYLLFGKIIISLRRSAEYNLRRLRLRAWNTINKSSVNPRNERSFYWKTESLGIRRCLKRKVREAIIRKASGLDYFSVSKSCNKEVLHID